MYFRAFVICALAIGTLLAPLRLLADPAGAIPKPIRSDAAIANWIASLQYTNPSLPSYGALRLTDQPGYRAPDGTLYYEVSPYDADLGALGLLRTHAPNAKEIALRWMTWYFAHMGANGAPGGVVYNEWYRKAGTGETASPPGMASDRSDYVDAVDSQAALLIGVAWEYHQAGGALPAGAKTKLEAAARAILALQQPDGLTWAKASYHAAYTMDNSEVYFGLCAMANLESGVFSNPGAATPYLRAALRVRRGILQTLYDDKTKLFAIAAFDTGPPAEPKLATWYPDTVEQVWPVLFGVVDSHGEIARASVAALDNAWNGQGQPDWTTAMIDRAGSTWPSIGYAAWLTGDTARARAHTRFVLSEVLPKGPAQPGFAPPFSVSDAGWLIACVRAMGIP